MVKADSCLSIDPRLTKLVTTKLNKTHEDKKMNKCHEKYKSLFHFFIFILIIEVILCQKKVK